LRFKPQVFFIDYCKTNQFHPLGTHTMLVAICIQVVKVTNAYVSPLCNTWEHLNLLCNCDAVISHLTKHYKWLHFHCRTRLIWAVIFLFVVWQGRRDPECDFGTDTSVVTFPGRMLPFSRPHLKSVHHHRMSEETAVFENVDFLWFW